jgi:hypothetical protein
MVFWVSLLATCLLLDKIVRQDHALLYRLQCSCMPVVYIDRVQDSLVTRLGLRLIAIVKVGFKASSSPRSY